MLNRLLPLLVTLTFVAAACGGSEQGAQAAQIAQAAQVAQVAHAL